jgi:murein DD-endopeptidase MepM/ murein hydrolase activator NlpD
MNATWMRGVSLDLPTGRLYGGPVGDNAYLDITFLFGWRAPILTPAGWTGWIDPITGLRVDFHYGLDLWAPQWGGAAGCPLRALGYGVVTRALYDPDGFGNWVEVTYVGSDGTYKAQYFHMRDACLYSEGTLVTPGVILGYMGSTGRSAAPHLHMAVYLNDHIVDPLSLFAMAQPLGYVPPAPVVPVLYRPAARIEYAGLYGDYWQHRFEVRIPRKQKGAYQQTGQPRIDGDDEVWDFDVEDWA